ncbi:membrane protein [Microbacterium phage Pumpernickel]|uniref:Membrane protein n=1 Tax=Microbacterium phage Pumpernickel TaxID=2885983 RepID=A0AAE8Y7R3_9CAUD|nr:membrane protein [Microbacterium phage Pumpernickel]UDL15998.1 membrane protein [Microbacterium phage Pumpernickel]
MRNLAPSMRVAIIVSVVVAWFVASFLVGQFGSTLVATGMIFFPLIALFLAAFIWLIVSIWRRAIRDQKNFRR